MKLNVKKFVFFGVFVCAFLALLLLRNSIGMQTNLTSLVNIGNSDWPINNLTDKFSNVINIVIKSDNLEDAKYVAYEITDSLKKDKFDNFKIINTGISLQDTVANLNSHRNSFLSNEYRTLLQNQDFDKISSDAIANISGAMSPTILSLTDDPFLLMTNYISQLKYANGKWNLRDGFLWQYKDKNHYILISGNLKNTETQYVIDTVDGLSKLLKKHDKNNTQTFMSGIPVHTAQMTSTSKIQLNIFSILALFAAVFLNWLLFKKISTLLPVILSLTMGFIAGAVALFLCFSQPHILTFVFGVTLIGLGVDYSFHFISAIAQKIDIRKNVLHSFLTTIVCFLPLLFSGLSLLQQISVFTITGLSAIYAGWLIFTPQKINANPVKINMQKTISGKWRSAIIITIIVAICATLPFVQLQNNMSQLYRPNAELLNAEKLVQDLSNMNQSKFLFVRGKTMDEALETSEKIKQEFGDFFDLATVIPSRARQIENKNLIKSLYKSQSKKIRNELGLRATPRFVDTPLITETDILNDKMLGELFNKFVLRDDNFVYIISNVSPDYTVSDENVITMSATEQLTNRLIEYSHKSYQLLFACGLTLFLLLLAVYGKRAFIYLAPCVLATGLTIAVLTWFNQPITFFHLLSLFIVIGLTLDYSIFHINAKDNREITPVLFSFLTSFIGFGILSFTSFFLIQSMGITLGLGLALGYIISLLLFRHTK